MGIHNEGVKISRIELALYHTVYGPGNGWRAGKIIKMVRKVMQGIVVNDEMLAIDTIKSVGPGGDHLIQAHTVKYMRTLPSAPHIIERSNYDRWMAKGGTHRDN